MSNNDSSSHLLISKKQYQNDTSDDAEELEETIEINKKKTRKTGKKYDQYCSF